jgi:hypothetical protein
MDWVVVVHEIAPPLFGALAAYLAIREDIAVLKTRQSVHEKEIESLRDWKETVQSK